MAPRNLKTYSKNNKVTKNKNTKKEKEKEKIKKYIDEDESLIKNVKPQKRKKMIITSLTSTDTSKSYSESSIHPVWAETTFDKLLQGSMYNLKPPPNVVNHVSDSTITTESDVTNTTNHIRPASPKLISKKPKKIIQKRKKTVELEPVKDHLTSTLPEHDINLVKLIVEPEPVEKSVNSDSVSFSFLKKIPIVRLEQTSFLQNSSINCSNGRNPLGTPNFKKFMASTPIKANNVSDEKLTQQTKVLLTPLEDSSPKETGQAALEANNLTKSIFEVSEQIVSNSKRSSCYALCDENTNFIGYKKPTPPRDIENFKNPYVKLIREDLEKLNSQLKKLKSESIARNSVNSSPSNTSKSRISGSFHDDHSSKFRLKIRLKKGKKQNRSIYDSLARTSAKVHKTNKKPNLIQKSDCKDILIDLTENLDVQNENLGAQNENLNAQSENFVTTRRNYRSKPEEDTVNEENVSNDSVICIDTPVPDVITLSDSSESSSSSENDECTSKCSASKCSGCDCYSLNPDTQTVAPVDEVTKPATQESNPPIDSIIDLSNVPDDEPPANLNDSRNTSSTLELNRLSILPDEIFLRTGKQWRRSLNILRRSIGGFDLNGGSPRKGRQWRFSLAEVLEDNNGSCLINSNVGTDLSLEKENLEKSVNLKSQLPRRTSVRFVQLPPLTEASHEESTSEIHGTKKETDLQIYARITQQNFEQAEQEGYVSIVEKDQFDGLDGIFENLSLAVNSKTSRSGGLETRNSTRRTSRTSIIYDFPITARDIVLKRCNQTEPLDFDYCYPEKVLRKCHKIGEGVYGEVFLLKTAEGRATVLKVIPIEGDQLVNGERQKRFDEIISEIIIAQELSGLRNNCDNRTSCFVHVQAIRCVRGRYPAELVDLWELYDEDRGSENDHPSMFQDDQLYIVLELEHGGRDLESYQFISAEQSYAIFMQTAFALAVAEKALKFEHRDLHWGNLLIQPTDEKEIEFELEGVVYKVPTEGVKATIIDFTLSRVTYENVCIYNNLAEDPDLFKSVGDYQFEVYKLMQKQNCNEWEHFEPFTNILWLHYTILKMIDGARYRRTKTLKHTRSIQTMQEVSNQILPYSSAVDFVKSFYKDLKL